MTTKQPPWLQCSKHNQPIGRKPRKKCPSQSIAPSSFILLLRFRSFNSIVDTSIFVKVVVVRLPMITSLFYPACHPDWNSTYVCPVLRASTTINEVPHAQVSQALQRINHRIGLYRPVMCATVVARKVRNYVYTKG